MTQEDKMWERLYAFMNFLNLKVERYPEIEYFTIEMDVDLYQFCNDIKFIPDNGIFKFKNKTFILG